MWTMPSMEEKVKAITIDDQRPLEAFIPNMQFALSKEKLKELSEIMLSRVGYPCELYRQGMLEQRGILKFFDENTLSFDIE